MPPPRLIQTSSVLAFGPDGDAALPFSELMAQLSRSTAERNAPADATAGLSASERRPVAQGPAKFAFAPAARRGSQRLPQTRRRRQKPQRKRCRRDRRRRNAAASVPRRRR
eukprot:TRINITY_DN37287_c0_g1_i1.p2 TRINITY_DN37287_c0_g1~~TRINITY_DN37287_c0_g1_i1.p2  ORF type:complete len:111 (-),score=16.37 TRINITY_DN37287_c0_g1_i1:8-340(-)